MEVGENLILQEILKLKPDLQQVKDSIDNLNSRLVEFIKVDSDKIARLEERVIKAEADIKALQKYNEDLEKWKQTRSKIFGFFWNGLGFRGIVQESVKSLFFFTAALGLITITGYGMDRIIHREPQSVNIEATVQTKHRQIFNEDS